MATPTLTFVIVGKEDHPIYEVDLTGPKEVRNPCVLFVNTCPGALANRANFRMAPNAHDCLTHLSHSNKPSTCTSSSCTRLWMQSTSRCG